MAIGASRAQVMRSVFVQGMKPVLVGLSAGLLAAIAAAAALNHVLYEVSASDPLSVGVVSLVLLLASALACYLPARRAADIQPAMALRAG